MKFSTSLAAFALATAVTASLVGCGSTSSALSSNDRSVLRNQVADARNMFLNQKPETRQYFDTAHAYAIFPSVTSGALIVGGAGGNGEVYQGGKLVGTADIAQGNIGAQIGGQEFAEVVFFQNAGTFDEFTRGDWSFDAKATAVAADAGGSKTADYEKGVRVFTIAKSGLMAQAAIGTQKLRFRSLADQPMDTGTATERN